MEISFEGKKKVNADVDGYTIPTDQPILSGGEDSAPTPYDLFLASIGTCAGIFVKSFCDRHALPTENIRINEEWNYDRSTGLVDFLRLEILLPSDFPEEYREPVMKAASGCKVKRSLVHPPKFEVVTSVLTES